MKWYECQMEIEYAKNNALLVYKTLKHLPVYLVVVSIQLSLSIYNLRLTESQGLNIIILIGGI